MSFCTCNMGYDGSNVLGGGLCVSFGTGVECSHVVGCASAGLGV